jgi:acetylornithine deacetylase/succinyl-diaminopimelate desuccinylase-like protein
MDAITAARRYARGHRDLTLERLGALIGFPTVSAEAGHAPDMAACAAWLARLLRRIGLTGVQVWPGRMAPVVTAGWHGRPGRPTLLVYGHYDVQPVEPLSAWATDPFRPVRDGPYLYARGASDDKGQLMAHLAAIEAWLAATAGLPLNLRLVLDGEEEIGSPTLVAAAARRWPPLAADVALVSDTWMLSPCRPVLITGLRGVIGARLEVSRPGRDLHAGSFGGRSPIRRKPWPRSSPACTASPAGSRRRASTIRCARWPRRSAAIWPGRARRTHRCSPGRA